MAFSAKFKAFSAISAIFFFAILLFAGNSAFAQNDQNSLENSNVQQTEYAEDYSETSSESENTAEGSDDNRGIQLRLWGGGGYGTVFASSIRLDGNQEKSYTTSFNTMNTGLEGGYAWDYIGLYLRAEFTKHWLKKACEIPTKEQWISGEIEVFFKGFWNPKDFLWLYIGIGAGIYLSEKAYADESDTWNKTHFALPIELGLEFVVTPNMLIGTRVNTGFFGFLKGTFEVRADLTLGFMF